MPNLPFSGLPSAGPLDGSELLCLSQSGTSVKEFLGSVVAQIAGVIASSFTCYASPSGNDANDGLTALTPKTINGLSALWSGKTLIDGVTITAQLLNGTYNLTNSVRLPFYYGQNSGVVVQGDLTNRNNVILDDSVGYADGQIIGTTGIAGTYNYTLKSFTIQRTHTNNTTYLQVGGGNIFIGQDLTFGKDGNAGFCHIYITNAGHLAIDPACTRYYAGSSSGAHIVAQGYSICDYLNFNNPFTFDTDGSSINFSNGFVECDSISLCNYYAPAGSIGVSGSVTGPRANATGNSVFKGFIGSINTFFPGNASAVSSTGGQFT